MYTVINITLPFFLLIFAGSFLSYIKFINKDTLQILAKTAFYVLMPPMIFLNLATSDVSVLFNFKFIVLYELATILLFLFAIPIGLIFKLHFNSIGMFGLISAYPNYGYIGIPLTLVAFGPDAATPMALILFSNTFMLLLLTSIYMAIHNGSGSFKLTALHIIKNLLLNPLIISVMAGIMFATIDIIIPRSINSTLLMLSNAAAPVALIALGASLKLQKTRSGLTQVLTVTFLKLTVHPILIFAIFLLWSGQDKLWIQTAIVCASLPVAANVFVLASNYDNSIEESANAIFFSTLLSTITVPIFLFVLLNSNYLH